MSLPSAATQALLPRLVEEGLYRMLRGLARAIAALPSRWVLRAADRLGDVLYLFDRRGRTAGRQNLDVVFGPALPEAERRAILRDSMRGAARSILILLPAAPLTPARFRRWVEVPPGVEDALRAGGRTAGGAVVVSGHLGNWEILLGMAGVFRDLMSTTFLVETSVHPAVDRFLAYLRGTGGGASAPRKGGALALSRHVRRGGIAALLFDRNVRRNQGGIWAPLFGLQTRTTPLPALLARKNDVPIAPVFCLPRPDGRYEIALGPEVSMDVRTGDLRADVREITTRLNGLLEDVIREHPHAWNWTLKRFKSRPTREQGAYPPYSLFDPG
ncbi:MAG: lysophospholipid acyltransferase family protein [Planctomycetota bacterium]